MIDETLILPLKLQRAIQSWMKKFPKGKQASAVIMALRLVQDEFGYLQDKHLDAVANFLQMPKIQVYQVACFYSMYRQSPVGKHVLSVCRSVSCYLRDADHLIDAIKQKLNIGMNETSACGMFTLKEAECLGSCCQSPCVLVNDNQYHLEMTAEKVQQLIDRLQQEGEM